MSDPGDAVEDSSDAFSTAFPARIAAIRDSSIIMLLPEEVRYARSDGHAVWLQTDRGRLRAVVNGFTNIEQRLARLGFLRVHRSYLVNVGRIREVNRSVTGALTLTTDAEADEAIPVSRRSAARIRQILGI